MTISLTAPPEASSAAFWIGRLHNAERQLATPEEIHQLNLRIASEAPSITPPLTLDETIKGDALLEKIRASSLDLSRTWYDGKGVVLPRKFFPALATLSDLTSIPKVVPIQFGVTTRRTSVRTYPTPEPVLKEPDQIDLDRLQETIAKPCEPVAIYWSSRGDEWLFCQIYNYAGWIRAEDVANFESRDEALQWFGDAPLDSHPNDHIVVTGRRATTAFSPSRPSASEVALDMGAWLPSWPLSAIQHQVDGQTTTGNHVIRIPDRARDGQFVGWLPAIVPACEDARVGPLPLTRANIVRQAFKCLGERYGWGGAYNARDCSSFIADIFACFGIFLPRNASPQAKLKSGTSLDFRDDASPQERSDLLDQLSPGAALYLNGHVMLYLGKAGGRHFVIHDFHACFVRDSLRLLPVPINQVAVTDLSLLRSDGRTLLESIYRAKDFTQGQMTTKTDNVVWMMA